MRGRECSTLVGAKRYIQGFGGEPDGKEKLGRPRRKWENIKIDIQEIE